MIYSLTVTNSIGESMTFELSKPQNSGYAVRLIDGVGTPDMNVNSTPYGIGDGSVLGSIKSDYRLITISLWPLKHPTVETARQRLYRFFQIKKPIILTFNTENRLVYIEGYVQKIEPNIFENPETVDIEVKCLYPYFRKMTNDLVGFYGVQPAFEFIFSCEFEFNNSLNWKIGELSNGLQWKDFVFARDRYLGVGIGEENTISYSYNAYNWNKIESPISKSSYWSSVTFGQGKILAVLKDSNIVYYKHHEVLRYFYQLYDFGDVDLEDMTEVEFALPIASYTTQVDYDKTVDDILSELNASILGFFGYRFMQDQESQMIVVYDDKGNKVDLIVRIDGIAMEPINTSDWNIAALPFNAGWSNIIFGDDRFVAISSNDSRGAYSFDGINWIEMDLGMAANWSKLIYGNDYFVAMERDSKNIIYSKDGIDWDKVVLSEIGPWHDIAYGNGRFILTRSNNGNWLIGQTPDNLIIFNQPSADFPFSIGYGENKFVVIKDGSDVGFISTDGINWIQTNMPFVDIWQYIGEGRDRLAVFTPYGNVTLSEPGHDIIDPIEFSYYTIDNRTEINYQGEIDAGIRITIECQTAPGDIIIYNVDTLEYIQIFSERIETVTGFPLGPKDIIEISTESGNKYVRLLRNGIYYNILGAMNRAMTWFTLQQGPNIFTYTTSDEHAAIVMTFSYNDTYAAI